MADTAAGLSDIDYRARAEAALAAIERQLDAWLQADVIDIDGQRTGGMLEMRLPGGGGVLIVNLQPPLRELWLAARAGGHHFRWQDGRWCDTRDGAEFFDSLSRHASAQAGQALRFSPPAG